MKQCQPLKVLCLALALAGIAAASAGAWDEGYFSLILPAKTTAPLAVEPEIALRMFNVIPPSIVGHRFADGVILFNAVRFNLAYCTNLRELSGELSGWFPVGDFRFGGAVEGIWSDVPLNPLDRFWNAAVTAFGTGWIVKDVFNVAFNVQYDFYNMRLNGGLGLSVAIIPEFLSIVAEGMISPIGTLSWAWTAGILIKTLGHQFIIYVGNGNDPRMRNNLASVPAPGALSFGLGLRRRIDIFF